MFNALAIFKPDGGVCQFSTAGSNSFFDARGSCPDYPYCFKINDIPFSGGASMLIFSDLG